MSDTEDLSKSTQEQAVAAWVNYLNQVRLDNLLNALRQQDGNLQDALTSISEAIRMIDLEVVARNRGGTKGMHGFIAEVAEVGVGNARSQIRGDGTIYQFVNDNGPVDLIRSGVNIQQKFVAAGGSFSLRAVTEHLQKYPEYITNGGKYQIPRDYFDAVCRLRTMSREEATRVLTDSGDGLSFKQWNKVQSFFEDGSIGFESLEPSTLDYRDVQRGSYRSALESEVRSLRSTDQELRKRAHQAGRPTLNEGAKVTIAAAAIEGGTTFVMAIAKKRREGKNFNEFTGEDWSNIAGDTGFGFLQGGIRGFSIYSLTNFTATSAAVATAIVTAAFGIAEQANKFRRDEIDEQQFIENAELVSLEAAVGALSSFVGQAFIPAPILGAVIGNAVGIVMYRAASSSLSKREAVLIERHLREQRTLDKQLAVEYQTLIETLESSMSDYLGLLERAFSLDVEAAFLGSVELASELGVASDDILDSEEKARAYFLD